MWLLVIILFNPLSHNVSTTVLRSGLTEEQCSALRNYVGFHMAEAYPMDSTIRIECQWRTR